jgi:large subunit ribosomal protein L21
LYIFAVQISDKSAGAFEVASLLIMHASRKNVKKKKMYAIVEIAGQQFKVEAGKKIFVHRLEAAEGEKLEFNQVLLIEDEGKITVGEPVIKDAVVEGQAIGNVRGDKVIVFKKKRKKGYRIKNGHRQDFTQVEILSINGKGSLVKKAAPKKETVKAAEEVTEEPVKAKKAAAKKPAEAKEKAEKTAEKKPAAKKAAKSKE